MKQSSVSLATTALEDFWDKSKPLVFLGDWCFADAPKRRSLSGLEILEYPWNISNRTDEDFRYCNALYESLLSELSNAFNRIHSTSHSIRYWRIVAGPWLHSYIQALYERYQTLRAALKTYPNLTSICLSAESYQTPEDCHHYYRLLSGDRFNLQMYSHVLSALGVSVSLRSATVEHKRQARPSFRQWVGERLVSPLARMAARHSDVVLADTMFNERELLQLFVGSRFRIRSLVETFSYWKIPTDRFDQSARTTLSEVSHTDEFTRILADSLRWAMPYAYVEAYSRIRREVGTRWPEHPSVIVASYLFYFHEYGKVWMAEQAEKGCRIISAQHGGSFGLFKRCYGSYHEPVVADESWSWGWSRASAPNVKPMPSPKLGRRLQRREQSSRILLLPWSTLRYVDTFTRSPFGSQMRLYYEELARFLDNVDERLRPQVVARPHFDIHDLEYFSARFNWLKRDDPSISFEQSLRNSRIAVVAYVGTTFLEVLAANLPSIFFWNPTLNPMHPEIEQSFQLLRDVHILHDCPIDAAKHLNSVYDEPSLWWNSESVQKIREDFLKLLVRIDPDYINKWKSEILPVAANGQRTDFAKSAELKS